jgi:hypothetical protein
MGIMIKNWFNNLIVITIVLIFVSGFIIDLYFKHETDERNIIALEEKTGLLRDAFSLNLTRTGKNNVYATKSYLSLKKILDSMTTNIIEQYGLGNAKSCGEVVTRLNEAKSAYEYLNITEEDKDLFFKTLKNMRLVKQDDPAKVNDLLYIESCFTRK